MISHRAALPAFFMLTVLGTATAQVSPATPPDRFITVNGVRLQYLDWGGTGEALLFLTCLGGTAADFQPLAARFTDSFHVLGLTRRGQGKSDKPEIGYDTATLTQDIVAFLDAMSISRVTLVGYSLAGNELTELAGTHPQRVAKLVYLDAAYDLAENAEHPNRTDLTTWGQASPVGCTEIRGVPLFDHSNRMAEILRAISDWYLVL